MKNAVGVPSVRHDCRGLRLTVLRNSVTQGFYPTPARDGSGRHTLVRWSGITRCHQLCAPPPIPLPLASPLLHWPLGTCRIVQKSHEPRLTPLPMRLTDVFLKLRKESRVRFCCYLCACLFPSFFSFFFQSAAFRIKEKSPPSAFWFLSDFDSGSLKIVEMLPVTALHSQSGRRRRSFTSKFHNFSCNFQVKVFVFFLFILHIYCID